MISRDHCFTAENVVKTYSHMDEWKHSADAVIDISVCVAVKCRWMHMNRERGEGRGEGESMRDLSKRRRHGLGGWLFEIINILLIVVQVDEQRLMCTCHCVCVCVCVYCLIGEKMVIKAKIIKVFVC